MYHCDLEIKTIVIVIDAISRRLPLVARVQGPLFCTTENAVPRGRDTTFPPRHIIQTRGRLLDALFVYAKCHNDPLENHHMNNSRMTTHGAGILGIMMTRLCGKKKARGIPYIGPTKKNISQNYSVIVKFRNV